LNSDFGLDAGVGDDDANIVILRNSEYDDDDK
jgi:hypothetical protein